MNKVIKKLLLGVAAIIIVVPIYSGNISKVYATETTQADEIKQAIENMNDSGSSDNTETITVASVMEKVSGQTGAVIDADSWKEVKKTASSNNKAVSGLVIYKSTYTYTNAMSRDAAVAAIESRINSGKGDFITMYARNGMSGDDQSYKEYINGYGGATIYNLLQKAATSKEVEDYINLCVTIGYSRDYLVSNIAKARAGSDAELPIIWSVPAVVRDGNLVDLYTIGVSPIQPPGSDENAINKQISELFLENTGSTMGGILLGEGSVLSTANTYRAGTTESGSLMYLDYASMLDFSKPVQLPYDYIIGSATPKGAKNYWEKKKTVTGLYKAKVVIGNETISSLTASELVINVTADFNSGDLQGLNGGLTAETITPKVSGQFGAYTTINGSNLTIKLPAQKILEWNDTACILWTVEIRGGKDDQGEQARPFTVSATVNGRAAQVAETINGGEKWDEKWKEFGAGKGTTYTSWSGGKVDTPDMPYDWHSAAIPEGITRIEANEVNNQDWSIYEGIPSTENVSIKAGASAGMVDIAGYLCARTTGSVSPTGNQEEDGLGVPCDPIVTRNIVLQAQVSNCWGGNNNVCQLSREVVYSKSYSHSHSDGHVDNIRTYSCPGHSCGSGSVGGGTYKDEHHTASEYKCGNHYNGEPGWTSYEEWHDGDCGGFNENIQKDGEGNEISRSCACKSCSSGSAPSNNHDCGYSITIYDSINEDYIGQKMPKTGSATGKNSGEGSHGLVEISRGANCGIDIHWTISWKPSQDEQYYIVTYDVWNGNIASGASGCNNQTRGASGNKNWGSDGTHYTGVNNDRPLCEDYTHGTGTSHDGQENMVHPGTHTYTITYKETIDAYVYRTITNLQFYSLQGVEIIKTHTITRDDFTSAGGVQYNAGTFSAPLEEGANGRGVNAPDALGVLWRCTGPNNGEYKDGNGRIYFEQWKLATYKCESNNVSVQLSRTDYFLGDVKIILNANQDNVWGRGISGEDTWEPDFGESSNSRGKDNNRIHTHALDTCKGHTSASDTKYLQINTGDCTTENFNADDATNNLHNHNTLVKKELRAIINAWQGFNSNLGEYKYKANVIPDTAIYGGTKDTNDLLDDSYSVDDGVVLFNVHGEANEASLTVGGTNNCGEKTVYRNHSSKWGIGRDELQAVLKGETLSTASISDGGILESFGLNMDGSCKFGGNKGIGNTLAGALKSNTLHTNSHVGVDTKFSNGDVYTSNVYSGTLKPEHRSLEGGSGLTYVTLTEHDSRNTPRTFNGYWNDHNYTTIGSTYLDVSINGGPPSDRTASYSDLGTESLSKYDCMAISDIKLVDWTPNGTWFTGDAGARYMLTMSLTELPEPAQGWTYNTSIAKSHEDVAAENVVAPAGSTPGDTTMSKIYIYDPISVETSYVIGAQKGSWVDSVTDDRPYDQRVDENGNPLDQSTVDTYVVQSRYLWSWLSPIGDFSSIGGTGVGSNVHSGEIYRNTGNKGYVTDMNVNRWIDTGGISYPFIAGLADGVTHTNRSGIRLPITVLKQAIMCGGTGLEPADIESIDRFGLDKNITFFGNGYAATNTVNCFEADDAEVGLYAYAINCFKKISDSVDNGIAEGGYKSIDNPSNLNKEDNRVKKIDYTDVVGSIGNITIHDTTDFRFSNFFKEALSPVSYLVDGVIKKVDDTKPINTVSTFKDIMFEVVTKTLKDTPAGIGHATTGVDVYTNTSPYYGMGGSFELLPLVPRYNNVEEYKSDALRLGYKAYMSVDTIGNYYSMIYNDTQTPDGPGDTDTRKQYLEVDSIYYLYDLMTGNFYDIDLWSGSTGSKERLYNGKSHKSEYISKAGAIYQNVLDSEDRRNIGIFERSVTEKWMDKKTTTDSSDATSTDINQLTYLQSDVHYIGTPGKIKLDTRDLSYIGSSINLSLGYSWGEYGNTVGSNDTSSQGQRYHFISGLTSTTFPTKPLGLNPTQQEIREAYEQMIKDHPHAVIVEFQRYTAHGTLWTIQTNAKLISNTKFFIYDTSNGGKYLPQDLTDDEKSKIKNEVDWTITKVYDPHDSTVTPTSIDTSYMPVIVYEAYRTSAEDRTTSGTH